MSALARHHAYRLLGELLLVGLTPATLPHVLAVPELAETLPTPLVWDEVAAATQQLWGFHLFPFESLFLEAEGLVGTRNDGLLAHYRRAAFPLPTESADHVGVALHFLGWLAGQEAQAGNPASASAPRHAQQRFLAEHLLRWLPTLAAAVQRHAVPFHSALVTLALDVATDHFLEGGAAAPDFALPAPPLRLDNPRTGLRDIAAFLSSPPYSGLFLSRGDWQRLARALRLPHGFGGREQMAETLLRSAAQYDALPTLLERVQSLLDSEHAALTAWASSPRLAPFAQPWQHRLRETAALLTQVGEQAALTPES